MTTDLRKIDALIAEHVYGWKKVNKAGLPALEAPDEYVWIAEIYINERSPIPDHYSTSVDLAIGVLEKIHERGWDWSIERYTWLPNNFSVCLSREDTSYTTSYSRPLPEAVCRHVLHVLGVSIPEEK